jgi:regulator of sirC expression with transglutaminase-like and TPR domain
MGDEHRTGEQAFTAISHEACPSVAETLLAVVAAWRPVDHLVLDGELDQMARALFGAEPDGRERSRTLAAFLTRELRPDATSAEGLWLDEVLATRRGHPVMIAALAAELGRRAGWEISVCSTPTAWYAGLVDGDVLWLIEPTGAAAGVPTTVRRHCAHELAYVVLTGLAERFESQHDRDRARRLRDRLALFEAPDHPGEALLGALWTRGGSPR